MRSKFQAFFDVEKHLKNRPHLLFLRACLSEMAGVEKAYAGYFHNSTQSNVYGYPVYTRNNLLYPDEANKVAGFAGEYDLQKALKDKNIRDIANAYGWDENTLRNVEAWSEVGANIAAGWAGHKLATGSKPQENLIRDNIGRNNPKYNQILNESITEKPHIQKIQKTQDRVNEIARQFNTKSIEPKNMNLTINGKTYSANPKTSIGAPVYQSVSNQDVISYFKELTGVDKLPMPTVISRMKDIDGNDGKVWSIKPTEGPLKGSIVNLRNFSTSQGDTNAKFTIEIIRKNSIDKTISGIKKDRVEIKFEK